MNKKHAIFLTAILLITAIACEFSLGGEKGPDQDEINIELTRMSMSKPKPRSPSHPHPHPPQK